MAVLVSTLCVEHLGEGGGEHAYVLIWVKVGLSMQCVDLGEGGGEHAMCGSGLGEQFWRLLGDG